MIVENLGTELVWQVVGSVLAVLISIVAVSPVILRRAATSPARLNAGALLAALLPAALTRILLVGWTTPGTERLRVTTFAAEQLLGPLTAGPAVMVVLLAGIAALARSPDRRWRRSFGVGCAALAVAGTLIAVGHSTHNPWYADPRAVVVFVAGALAAAGSAAGGPDAEGGTDAATAAAAVFPVIVALGEASERGLVWLIASTMTSRVTPELWDVAVWRMRDAVTTEWTASWVVVGIASLGAAASAFERRRPVRSGLAWGLGVGVAIVVLAASELSAGRLQILAAVCTGVLPTE